VHRDPLGMHEMEAVALEERAQRSERVEGQMLVVQRVPLHQLEQVAGVHHLQAQMPRGCEHRLRRLEDALRLLVVRKCIASGHDVGEACALTDFVGRGGVEEAGHHLQPFRPGELRDVL
jgi:hypothetical protein